MRPTRPQFGDVVDAPTLHPVVFPDEEADARTAFFKEGRKASFFKLYDRAEAGSSPAQALIASMYLYRWVDCGEPLMAAEYWAQESASKNNPYGYWILAWTRLEMGLADQGIETMFESAEMGFSPAIFDLGTFLFHGMVVPKNMESGLRLVQKAAASGHTNARRFIRSTQRNGLFGKRKKFEAIMWEYISKPFRLVYGAIRHPMFGPRGLVYLRSLHVRNTLRRRQGIEAIGSGFEDQLNRLIGSAQGE